MPGDTANPRIWVGADVLVAPVGTTAPTTPTGAWAAGWLSVGLLSEDGLTESRDVDSTDHFAYGGIFVRNTRSKHKRAIKFTCLEDNAVVFGIVNPGSTATTATGITTQTIKVPAPDPRAFGLDLLDGSVHKRRVIPKAEVVEIGEITFSDSEMVMYEITLDVYASGAGVYYLNITDDAQAVVA